MKSSAPIQLRDIQNLNDEELACKTQVGSVECFEELVRRYEKRIFHFLMHKTANWQDAEDLAQGTFVTAYQRIHKFKPSFTFSTWLFTIAKRLAISHYRASRPFSEVQSKESDTYDPYRIMAEREEKNRLWKLANRNLSENQFTVLWLKYAETLTIREIAKVMKKSQTHVKVLLHRARERLANLMQGLKNADMQTLRLSASRLWNRDKMPFPNTQGESEERPEGSIKKNFASD